MKKVFNLFCICLLFSLSFTACSDGGSESSTSQSTAEANEAAKNTAEEQATMDNLGKPTTYSIAIRTGCKEEAGTKAAVHIKLTGEAGSSEEFLLDIPTEENFNSCSNDIFKLSVPKDLGKLTELELWHDDAGEDPSWLVELVKIQNERTSVSWVFPCGKWFDSAKFDQKIKRAFVVGKTCE